MDAERTLVPVDGLSSRYKYHTTISVLRLDLVHPVISGNKWFKLRHYLARAARTGRRTVLTFGGAYSNHILATAAACREAGLSAIGIIRGERASFLNPTLSEAERLGMQLHFISRTCYREKKIPEELWEQHPRSEVMVVPEGGYGTLGLRGIADLLSTERTGSYTHILSAVGTGTTLAGLALGAEEGQKVIGIAVMKNGGLEASVQRLLPRRLPDLTILHRFHQGGYARHTPELLRFMNDWYATTGIPSDFVYTGKLFFAADQLLKEGYFPPGSRLLLVHTGGLQGNRSLPKGTLIF
jgi:1-aminocyclopropane-1-carboxylate deaminase